jgi:hypothetical protein
VCPSPYAHLFPPPLRLNYVKEAVRLQNEKKEEALLRGLKEKGVI